MIDRAPHATRALVSRARGVCKVAFTTRLCASHR